MPVEPWSETERRLVDAVRRGEPVDLSAGDPEIDNPARGAVWPATRTVGAYLVAQLVTGQLTRDNRRLRTLHLKGAHLTGVLDLEAAELVFNLELENCSFEEAVDLRDAQAAAIRLPGCHIPGITADGLHTRNDLELRRVVTTNAEVVLIGAHIGGTLCFDGANLTNPNGIALNAEGIQVDQTLVCRNGFYAQGEINLIGAHVGTRLGFDGANLTNPTGAALNADGIQVDLSVFCRDGFTAQGEIRMVGAHIGGTLCFDGAILTNPTGAALNADGIQVDQTLVCTDGFTAHGEIRMIGARVGQLDFTGATVTNPNGLALSLQWVSAVSLVLQPQVPPDGVVDLTNARVGSFIDYPESWPTEMRLRGFTYEVLENVWVSVRTRLRWLDLHRDGYAPGIFDQLAAAYRQTGHVEEARRVAIAKQRRRRRELNPLGKLWNRFLQATVGYGYRPWLAGVWLAGLLTIGAFVFAGAHPDQFHQASKAAPDFQPVVYTLDVLLPIVDFGQERAWVPQDSARVWAWGLTGAGWVLTTAFIAGLTNALKRD
jgi:hypothetical protein